ncbi:MAG: BON domain-containing protein [Pontibacterium sp.]
MNANYLLAALILSLPLSGCSNLISAGREAPIQEDHGSRTMGSYVDDELIETKARVNLLEAEEMLQGASVGITSFNGLVLLTGQAPSEGVRQHIEQIVGQLRKVRRIHNEISLSGTVSTLATASDTWLSLKAKSQLLADNQAPGNRIKVVTENGTVYLMGLVTQAEASAATTVISNISGVQKIVKIFEYIDQP